MIWLFISPFFMCLSLWVAFSPRFRPISWQTFYLNLCAVAINLASFAINLYYFLRIPA